MLRLLSIAVVSPVGYGVYIAADEVQDATQCVDWVAGTFDSVPFKSLMTPMLDGRYALSVDGKVLNSDLQMSTDSDDKKSQWNLELQKWNARKSLLPAVVLKNRKTKQFLCMQDGSPSVSDEQGSSCLWMVKLESDVSSIINAEEGVSLVVVEDQVAVTADETSMWTVKALNKVTPKRTKKAMKKQWEVAKNTPVFTLPGAQKNDSIAGMTWGALCNSNQCYKQYMGYRQRYAAAGRITEKDNVVLQVGRLDVCSWSLDSMVELLGNQVFLKELYYQGVHTGNCPIQTQRSFLLQARDAFADYCLDECVSTMTGIFQDVACDITDFDGQDKLFELADNQSAQCRGLLADTKESLAEWIVSQRCWNWPQPHYLWSYQDHEFGEVEARDQQAVCQIPHYAAQWTKDPGEIKRRGACPSGTACGCPQTWARSRPTVSMVRGDSGRSSFIGKGAAEVSSLLSGARSTALSKFVEQMIWQNFLGLVTGGALATQTLASVQAIITGPSIIMGVGMGTVMGLIRTRGAWRCAESAGCWPVYPKMQQNGCRIPDDAAAGGSPVWFLPPPGMQITRKFPRRCVLEGCGDEAMKVQTVGFDADGRQVYNCQPLNFGEMDSEQKTLYLEALTRTGIRDEYSLAAAQEHIES